jgi:hypothetical protein
MCTPIVLLGGCVSSAGFCACKMFTSARLSSLGAGQTRNSALLALCKHCAVPCLLVCYHGALLAFGGTLIRQQDHTQPQHAAGTGSRSDSRTTTVAMCLGPEFGCEPQNHLLIYTMSTPGADTGGGVSSMCGRGCVFPQCGMVTGREGWGFGRYTRGKECRQDGFACSRVCVLKV